MRDFEEALSGRPGAAASSWGRHKQPQSAAVAADGDDSAAPAPSSAARLHGN